MPPKASIAEGPCRSLKDREPAGGFEPSACCQAAGGGWSSAGMPGMRLTHTASCLSGCRAFDVLLFP